MIMRHILMYVQVKDKQVRFWNCDWTLSPPPQLYLSVFVFILTLKDYCNVHNIYKASQSTHKYNFSQIYSQCIGKYDEYIVTVATYETELFFYTLNTLDYSIWFKM